MKDEADSKNWIAAWLDGVVDGSKTMSQRKLSSIRQRDIDLETLKSQARAKGVHLLLLTDDRGEQLVAASLHPFEALC